MELGQTEKKMFSLVPGDYKLLEEVGQGVSATVYRAVYEPTNEVVAIKSLDLERCNSNLDEICREAKTMSLFSHPNVVKAHCSFVVDQSLWVVMPYMSGGSCLHIMKLVYPDGFDEPVIATVLKETLKALEYLHRHGAIHRDVKAGNILVDGNGAVKLGDFGVSACMFDTGDRQRSRNTFVGTPCWMAPEVMEQLHGYDFKADIWSFGITALELAHGHAPFSKYPPMKVLLMTLQNAPPGLDLERANFFSKSFKEMIAMCLVKDPTKRPTAEKLLRHSFFRHARSFDYIVRNILEGLPPLGERVKNLKIKDVTLLAQKKMPFDEQEERSQNEYKTGVSSWNFNLEDLKKQAALIQDDDENPMPKTVSEVEELLQQPAAGSEDDSAVDTSARSGPALGRKMSKHIGRFDVFEDDDTYLLASPGCWYGSPKETHKSDEQDRPKQEREEGQDHPITEERERRDNKEQERDDIHGSSIGHALASVNGRDEDRDGTREKDHRQGGQTGGEDLIRSLCWERLFSGSLTSTAERAVLDYRPANGVQAGTLKSVLSGNKESTEEKTKTSAHKALPILQKGRFSVTSDTIDLEDPPHSSARRNGIQQIGLLHKSASVGDWSSERRQVGLQHQSFLALQQQQQPTPLLLPTPLSSLNINLTAPVAALIPQLQHILQQGQKQQEAMINLLNCLSPNEATNAQQQQLHPLSRYSRSSSANFAADFSVELASDRERDLLHQVSELQARMTNLVDELQSVKLRNVGLERQLNAIYNKEEEERIRKEDAAKEDG